MIKLLKKIKTPKKPVLLAGAAFGGIVFISALLLLQFASLEKNRNLLNWETRLDIVASSRANAVDEWLSRQVGELESLANNTSLQLYASQLQEKQPQSADEPFQLPYLRNLITATAERAGFGGEEPVINANVQSNSATGIALLDKSRRIIVSTPFMPPNEGSFAEIIASLKAEKYISNIYKGANGKPAITFAVPVFSVQGEETTENLVGYIIGTQMAETSLFPLLKQPGATEKTAEAILVNVSGNIINYLSPTLDGAAALDKNLNTSSSLAEYLATQTSEEFIQSYDYSFNKVLATGRKINSTPWTLVYKINSNEALAESNAHIRNVMVIGMVTICFLAAAVLAIWHYANFLRERHASDNYRKMLLDIEAQKNLLKLITDNKPEAAFIVDGKNRYRFANTRAAQQCSMQSEEMIGQNIVAIMGKDKAMPYIKMNAAAMADKKIMSNTQRFLENGEDMIIQSCHIPIEHIPCPEDGKSREGVLVLENDITEPIKNKERHERILNSLIDALVSLIDKRDSYTADHSTRVAKLAGKIAEEMQLDEVLTETVSISGKLMNLGRMLIPQNLLEKIDLTKDERKLFENTTWVSAELLKDIEFTGPVVETIKQSHEKWDGSGQLKLKGTKILQTARIIGVANAFVSMRSPRAYRLMKTLDQTLEVLSQEAGQKYDRAVIAALVNYIENRGGREEWKYPEEIPSVWVGT